MWAVTAVAVAACGLAALLESADWGDGDPDRLSLLEGVALGATALAVVALAVWLTRRLRRGAG